MENKKHPPSSGEEEKKKKEELKNKINGFLINYYNLLIIFISLIILFAGLLILAYPKYEQISKENEEAKNKLQIEYETKFNYLNSIKNLKKSYQSIKNEEKAKISAMVPNTNDTSLIIAEIEFIAVRNSAILTSIKIAPQTIGGRTNLRAETAEKKEPPIGFFNDPPQGVNPVKIEINLSSVDYSILKNIVKSFENNLRLFDVAKVSYNAKENKALLNIYSYYSSR